MSRPLELLSPAKDIECGMAAIDHGADAVYIGAERFGARQAAGNPISDIKKLCDYAHTFKAKVYVTVNTIIYDNEIEATEKLINDLYETGPKPRRMSSRSSVYIVNVHNPSLNMTPELCLDLNSLDRAPDLYMIRRRLLCLRAAIAVCSRMVPASSIEWLSAGAGESRKVIPKKSIRGFSSKVSRPLR